MPGNMFGMSHLACPCFIILIVKVMCMIKTDLYEKKYF